MESKKQLASMVGAALLFMFLACTGPDFRRTIDDPVMTPEKMEAEFEELHQLNLTVGSGRFDPDLYPLYAGIDVRNGKTLIKEFICWDGCPESGQVYLVYQDLVTEEACLDATGSPVTSSFPAPGTYWGCEPIIDWLSLPTKRRG